MFEKAFPVALRKQRDTVVAPLAGPFWVGLIVLAAALLFTVHPQNWESAIGGAMIIAAGFLPSAIWILKGLGGLPVFPIFALMHVWAFGMPLLYEHPIVTRFDSGQQFFAALSVAGFLVIGTLVWHQMRLRSPKAPQRCLMLESKTAEALFLLVLAVSIVYTIALTAGWLSFIPSEVFGIIRSVMLALQALSCFVLSYRLGSGELRFGQASLFKFLFVGFIIVGLPSLYLVTPISLIGIATLGYVSASGRVPWISLIVAGLFVSFLHAGKGDMRAQYWGEAAEPSIEPWEYPVFFGDWMSSSIDGLTGNIPDEDEKSSSIVERSSLMQLLLYEQEMSPDHIPFMWGDTYIIVPELMIPRILYPARATSHEGTYRLNINYGFQTREDTENTTIGWGLLNESFANFGLFGMAGLAVVIGAFYGYVEGLALSVPLLSLRGLFVVLVACYAFQVEFSAGVWVTALFQSTIALLGLTVALMKSRPLRAAALQFSPPAGLEPAPGQA
jgi:hypothetical protein